LRRARRSSRTRADIAEPATTVARQRRQLIDRARARPRLAAPSLVEMKQALVNHALGTKIGDQGLANQDLAKQDLANQVRRTSPGEPSPGEPGLFFLVKNATCASLNRGTARRRAHPASDCIRPTAAAARTLSPSTCCLPPAPASWSVLMRPIVSQNFCAAGDETALNLTGAIRMVGGRRFTQPIAAGPPATPSRPRAYIVQSAMMGRSA